MATTIIVATLLLGSVAGLTACGGPPKYDGSGEYKFSVVSPSAGTVSLSEQLSVTFSSESGNMALQLRPDCQIQGQGTEDAGSIHGMYPCQIAIEPGNTFSVVFSSGSWTIRTTTRSSGDNCTTTEETLALNIDGTFAGLLQSNTGSGSVSLSFTGKHSSTKCERTGLCGTLSGLICN